jgi:thiol:disulfide interchange protein DsbC
MQMSVFARENGLAGTPVIVRSDGAVLEGYRPKEFLANWLKGAKS